MAIIYDKYGNPVDFLDKINGSSLVDNRTVSTNISSLNAEVFFDCQNTGSVIVDVRGTFSATLNVEATVDGINYFSIPCMIPTTEIFVVNISSVNAYMGHLPSGCKRVRVRCSAYTSGTAIVSMRGSNGDNILYSKPMPTTNSVTILGTVSTATTLTLSSGGVGLFHYITRLTIQKFASATLTAGTTPIAITTTNLPGSRAFSFDASAQVAGTIISEVVEMGGNPIKSSTSNTATTIVAPLVTNVIWRITADFYVGA